MANSPGAQQCVTFVPLIVEGHARSHNTNIAVAFSSRRSVTLH